MPIKNLGIEIQCDCGAFMRILNDNFGEGQTAIFECPKCKCKIYLRLRLGWII